MSLRTQIESLWHQRDALPPTARAPIDEALDALDSGRLRVAEPGPDGWHTHAWLKQAVLLSFRLNDSVPMPGAAGAPVFDKVPMKTDGWTAAHFAQAGFRAVPGAIVRRSAYVAPGAILMPCFINVGARVGAGTMIDTWSTVGSCAQVGANCHISGGVGLGGVLEPLQAGPVIIEDDCFIGARSEVAEGVIVEQGSVISMGVFSGRLHPHRGSRHRRNLLRARAGLFGGGGRNDAGTHAGAGAGVRSDCQAGGCADAIQDGD